MNIYQTIRQITFLFFAHGMFCAFMDAADPFKEEFATVHSEHTADADLEKIKETGIILKEKKYIPYVPPYVSRSNEPGIRNLEETEIDDHVRDMLRFLDQVYSTTSVIIVRDEKKRIYRKTIWERKNQTEVLLALLEVCRSVIEPDYKPKKLPEHMAGMTPCAIPDETDNTGQVFFHGMNPDAIKHPKTRERFLRELWEKSTVHWEADIQHELSKTNIKASKFFIQHVLSAYHHQPEFHQELIGLLEQYDYPFIERVKLLCKIGIPYKGYRQWESSDKLFQAAAKFITTETASGNVAEVILEKPDGKRTSIELSALRKEDQEYVREQGH